MDKKPKDVIYLWRFTAFDNRSREAGKYINRTVYVEARDQEEAVVKAFRQLGKEQRHYQLQHTASKMAEKIAEGVYDNYGKAK